MPRIRPLIVAILSLCPALAAAISPSPRLQLAISFCDVVKVAELLASGADPNAKDRQGHPVNGWMASSRKCDDAHALETAKLLAEHGAAFQGAEPSLLVKVATRGLPKTLDFLAHRNGAGDPTKALRAIARSGDLASIRVLLSAGADPLAGDARSSALLDAAAAGQGPTVAEMLNGIKDRQSPKVLAANAAAAAHPEVARMFREAGVVAAASARPEPPCRSRELTAAQAALLARVGLRSEAKPCRFVQECGDLLLIDCDSAADGPAYYIDRKNEKVLATCGGACMRGCAGCPPRDWTCECRM